MKKVVDILKPNILIVFGALLFLYFLNYLQYQGQTLAIGIIAIIMSAYYLTIGVLGVLIGNKFSDMLKKIFEVISVSLFGVFMFVVFLLNTISGAQINNLMGPTSWTIAIFSMIASLGFVAIYIISKFIPKPIMARLAYLMSAVFGLALLLDILFNIRGMSNVLGNIDIVLVVIYAVFMIYLFSTLNKVEDVKEEPKEEKAPEEAPKEEAAE